MNLRGFTLVELIVVIAVMTALMTIAMFGFNDYSRKAEVEAQTRKFYSDIMELRSKGLYEKHDVALRLSATKYELYTSAGGDPKVPLGQPYQTTILKRAITRNGSADNFFDAQGMSSSDNSICVDSSNDASVDSIIISKTMVKLGKLKDGESCVEDKIDAKQ